MAARVPRACKGPYYAAELAATVMYTVGGLQTNGVGATLDWNGSPIPGLYSAGDVGQPSGANPVGVCACGAMGALAVRDMVSHANRDIPGEVDAIMEKPNETAITVAAGGLYALSGEGQQGTGAGPSGGVTNSIISDATYKDGTYTGVGSSTIGATSRSLSRSPAERWPTSKWTATTRPTPSVAWPSTPSSGRPCPATPTRSTASLEPPRPPRASPRL